MGRGRRTGRGNRYFRDGGVRKARLKTCLTDVIRELLHWRRLPECKAFEGPDRTITWRAWKEASGGEFRVRTGDRYLGGQVWEHYLCFALYRASVKPIKLSMIRLGSEVIPEDVVIRPGLRYAIVKVTNDMMTAHKGLELDRARDPLKVARYWLLAWDSPCKIDRFA